MNLSITNNSASRFLIPYVIARREGEELRSGWDSAIGLYNPSDQSQRFRFQYFNDEGQLVAEFMSRSIPARSNLFDTPETMAQGRTYQATAGDPRILLERQFSGYLIVEGDNPSYPFHLSSWMARGGSDFSGDSHEQHKSFGFNRAGWQVPAIPTAVYDAKTTGRIIFPGLNLRPQGSWNDCPGSSVTGVPNGWDIGVSLVNTGSTSVHVRLSFIPDGSAAIVNSEKVVEIEPGRRAGLIASQYLPEDSGKGVLAASIEEGSSTVLGFAAQSDRRFQFFGYGVTGQVEFKDADESGDPSLITNLSKDFIVPYSVRVDSGGEGYNTGLSIFNPLHSDLNVEVNFIHQDGSLHKTLSHTIPGGGAFYRRLEELAVSADFLGWMRLTGESEFYCAAHVVRGGFDTELRGWQCFGFDVPAIPASTVAPIAGVIGLAVNESLPVEGPPTCPPLYPDEEEDVRHLNGFDIGLRLTNLEDAPIMIRLEFQKRYVGDAPNPSPPEIEVSPEGPHTIRPRESIGIVIGNDFGELPDLDDGAVIARVLSGPARLVGVAVESDRFFHWFSYSVCVQGVSQLPLVEDQTPR